MQQSQCPIIASDLRMTNNIELQLNQKILISKWTRKLSLYEEFFSKDQHSTRWPLDGRTDTTRWPLDGRTDTTRWPLDGRTDSTRWPLDGRTDSTHWPLDGKTDSTRWPLDGRTDSMRTQSSEVIGETPVAITHHASVPSGYVVDIH